ncbi:MAG: hypothetical protein QW279_01290 [Candidatus Jordarchaeaceae archaeon]
MDWKIALGTLLLLCGLVILFSYNAYVENYLLKQTYVETSSFYVSGDFIEGDLLVFDITPNEDWSNLYFDFIRTDYVPDYEDARIQIIIENTYGEKTVMDIIYVSFATIGGEYAFFPYAVTINSSSGGLNEIKKTERAGIFEGVVTTTANYSATLLTPELLYTLNSPPQALRLLRYVKQKDYPYREIAPVGFASISISVFALLFSIKSRNKTKRRLKKLK